MKSKQHWESVYETKNSTEVSWFQEHAQRSLQLIQKTGVSKSAAIIDVGSGASTLVDDLLAEGYERLTVLGISAAALETAKSRLGSRATTVQWLEADILQAGLPPHQFSIWHDRAVFHFLTEVADRRAYVQGAWDALVPGGFLIVATFAQDGPTQCSGLPVQRFTPEALAVEFASGFQLINWERESHYTPGGNEQRFVYCLFRKSP